MNLALFDLDNTLLACDSDYEWGQFLVDRGVLGRAEYEAQNAAFYEQYRAGTLDIHEFLGFALRPLAEHAPGDLERWHAEFMAARIRPAMGAPAKALKAGAKPMNRAAPPMPMRPVSVASGIRPSMNIHMTAKAIPTALMGLSCDQRATP